MHSTSNLNLKEVSLTPLQNPFTHAVLSQLEEEEEEEREKDKLSYNKSR